ncbi:chorion peroxidase-like [Daphnia carinata]|uniref:chorion peroxidase-like n=1 Tax=Daphnia carinata TaxID=120202 RepID=UPI002868D184|nr:chorion peroxidase-like [Daphnia carinata]
MVFILIAILALAAGTLSNEDASVRQATPLPAAPTCDPNYRYRTFDGTCNNLSFPRFGQAGTIFQRLMGPATYSNDLSAIRLAKSGNPLPSTRLVSTTVTVSSSVFDYDTALITMQWGQFMDHDLTQTPQFTITVGCCGGGLFGNVTANPNAECLHIPIPSNDPVYSNVNCMNMIRSSYGPRLDGSMPTRRQQINAITHWIDGSQIYGNSDSTAQSLRDKSSGKGLLAFSVQNGQVLLPTSPSTCSDCFVAGDNRVREQPLLTVMHTLWLREHNRVAKALYARFGSSKSDEFYYQEARRIVIAEFQHITYREYLPVILGPENPVPPFDTQFNPAIFNEFAAAAYRMGHSQLRSFIKLFEADGTASNQSFFLGNSFLTGAYRLLNPKFLDNALRGQLLTPAQSVDECFAPDVTSQLFRTTTALGADLVAINMQRGRDHGLPPYVMARQIALQNSGLQPYPPPPPPRTFDDLAPTHSLEVIASLKAVYESVEDIDLYIGGVTERPLPGAAVGPTFAYIIGQQFDNLRRSDRFFYANLGQTVSFAPRQFDEIRKVSLARIICDNNDGTITQIQPMAFRRPSQYNMPIPCSNIPGINFNYY